MNDVILLMGGNIGDTKSLFGQAKESIQQEVGTIVAASALYQTKAWGLTAQNDFLNQALHVQTDLQPREVLQAVLSIERALGRVRRRKWAERNIDIDILFYNASIIQQTGLTIPHPHLHERNFVLVPLNEIIPDWVHPNFQKTIATLLSESPDILDVEKLV